MCVCVYARACVCPVDMNIYVVAALCDLDEQYTMELDTGCKHLVHSNSLNQQSRLYLFIFVCLISQSKLVIFTAC